MVKIACFGSSAMYFFLCIVVVVVLKHLKPIKSKNNVPQGPFICVRIKCKIKKENEKKNNPQL